MASYTTPPLTNPALPFATVPLPRVFAHVVGSVILSPFTFTLFSNAVYTTSPLTSNLLSLSIEPPLNLPLHASISFEPKLLAFLSAFTTTASNTFPPVTNSAFFANTSPVPSFPAHATGSVTLLPSAFALFSKAVNTLPPVTNPALPDTTSPVPNIPAHLAGSSIFSPLVFTLLLISFCKISISDLSTLSLMASCTTPP